MPAPELSKPDGTPLPARLRFLRRLFAGGPRPVRSALLYATPRLIAPRLPALVARYPDGRAFFLPADHGPYAEVFTLGEFEPAQTAVVRKLLRPGDFAVDVGANLGWFSLVMADRVGPGGGVLALEPMPPTLVFLKKNLELNGQLPIELVESAVGAESGQVDIHLFEGLPHGHASASTLDRTDYATHRADVRRLDELLAGKPEPAFVKLDVEGSELAVLQGAEETLAAETPPIWMIEVNYETSGAFGYTPLDLLTPFRERGGYATYRIRDGDLAPELNPETAPNGSNWVLVPRGREDRL